MDFLFPIRFQVLTVFSPTPCTCCNTEGAVIPSNHFITTGKAFCPCYQNKSVLRQLFHSIIGINSAQNTQSCEHPGSAVSASATDAHSERQLRVTVCQRPGESSTKYLGPNYWRRNNNNSSNNTNKDNKKNVLHIIIMMVVMMVNGSIPKWASFFHLETQRTGKT